MSLEPATVVALEFIREHGIFAEREVVREMLDAIRQADASREALYREALDLLLPDEVVWLNLTGLEASNESH